MTYHLFGTTFHDVENVLYISCFVLLKLSGRWQKCQNINRCLLIRKMIDKHYYMYRRNHIDKMYRYIK